MNASIPVYVERVAGPGGRARHRVRPLFYDRAIQTEEQLGRALSRLAADLRETLQELGKKRRHDVLARWTFCPEIEHRRVELTLELKSGRFKCTFLVADFQALERRIAFTPSVPDCWFEIGPGEEVEKRAAESLTDYFRKREREEEIRFETPDRLSVEGRAWVTTLNLDLDPAQVLEDDEESLMALLGDKEVLDGETELCRVGRCLDRLHPDGLDRVLCREAEVAELTRLLTGDDRRPVLILGPRLVGKTALLHEHVYHAVSRRHGQHRFDQNVWLVSPQRLISGMSFVGQWENRLLAILKEVRKRDHVLYFDDLLGLYHAGQSCEAKLAVADVLRPYVERRTIRLVGEMTPEAFRVLRERDRGFADLFHLLPVRVPSDSEVLRILVAVVRNLEDRHGCEFDLDVLPTVTELQRRHNRAAAFPGKAATFLERLAVKAKKVTRQLVLDEFHAQSGLSLTLLDSKARLERAEVVKALEGNVIGQPAAIAAAADVVGIAKARLNDPDRPLAAFLFLGPTGVGKTQTAKALAKYLFGDADRLVRFDMNEFVDPGSAVRLAGTFDNPEGLLTAAVRRQPFAVVLLDEIEKAHPEVHDLLLQVLGEGRLTDALGRVVSFSDTLVILTSNLGVREVEGRLGYRRSKEEHQAGYVRAAERFFRPEFFNRLDRIVPFERLERDDVARIAQGLIRGIFGREGLLRRKCVLHVEPAAMDRVVDVGHDPMLGARALKRAIEKHLTRPVAMRLAAGLPETVTVVSLYCCGDFIAARVQALSEVSRQPALEERINLEDERGVLDRVENFVRRIEEQFAPLRPVGEITSRTLRPEHDRWFSVQEQVNRVRAMHRELAEELQQRREVGRTTPAYPTRVLDRASDPQSLLKPRSGGYRYARVMPVRGNYLGELAASQDIRDFLQSIADAATMRDRRTERLAALVRQVALLQAVADGCLSATAGQVLLTVESLHTPAVDCTGLLREAYREVFNHEMGLESAVLPEAGKVLGRSDVRALVVKGPHAAALTQLEAGTHLFCPEHEGLLPVVVRVWPLPDGADPLQLLAEERVRREGLMAAAAGGDEAAAETAFALPAVLRVYELKRMALDLRSGEVTHLTASAGDGGGRVPSPAVLRDWLLNSLPLPV